MSITNYLNFEVLCKNDLLAYIKNDFYMQYCDLLNKEFNFNFDPSNIGDYFNYELISEEEMYNFVCSIAKKELPMNNVSYKGINKNIKKYPILINPSIFLNQQIKECTSPESKQILLKLGNNRALISSLNKVQNNVTPNGTKGSNSNKNIYNNKQTKEYTNPGSKQTLNLGNNKAFITPLNKTHKGIKGSKNNKDLNNNNYNTFDINSDYRTKQSQKLKISLIGLLHSE